MTSFTISLKDLNYALLFDQNPVSKLIPSQFLHSCVFSFALLGAVLHLRLTIEVALCKRLTLLIETGTVPEIVRSVLPEVEIVE